MEIVASGKGGHSSWPPRQSTIAAIGRAVSEIEHNPMPAQLRTPVSDMLDHLLADLPFLKRLAVTNRWLFGPLIVGEMEKSPASSANLRTTIAPTIINGGIKSNVLPQEASVTFNVRLAPGDTIDDVLNHMAATTDAMRALQARTEADSNPPISLVVRRAKKKIWEAAPVADMDAWPFNLVMRTIGQVFPDVARAPGLVLVATDSRHYRQLTSNTFRFTPLRLSAEDLDRIHGTNERISVVNYFEIIRFYGQLFRNLDEYDAQSE